MRARPLRPRADGDERGFVIIGVVMFVLALTILGFTLFDMSGYEAQFTRNSIDSDAAFFSALGGIEHAKFVLAKTGSLDKVRDNALFPDPNLVYARAQRLDNGDTTGNLGSASPDIEIRVLAASRGESRMVQTRYKPFQTPNIYKRLMTVTGGVYVTPVWDLDPDEPPALVNLCGRVHLSGSVLQGSADLSWVGCVQFDAGGATQKDDLPTPDLTSYFSTFWGIATPVVDPDEPDPTYHLQGGGTIPGGPPEIQFFKTFQFTNTGATYPNDFSVFPGGTCTIDLSSIPSGGTAIWLLDHGFRADVEVEFVGGSNKCLVIVSKHCNLVETISGVTVDRRNVGIWFFGGFQNTGVSTIFVTDAQFRNEQSINHAAQSTAVHHVSVFANEVVLTAPTDANPFTMMMRHPSGSGDDDPGGRIEQLCEWGALPNSDAGGMKFTRVAGTFTELNPETHEPY